jgi:hypothetical protein
MEKRETSSADLDAGNALEIGNICRRDGGYAALKLKWTWAYQKWPCSSTYKFSGLGGFYGYRWGVSFWKHGKKLVASQGPRNDSPFFSNVILG